MEKELKNGDVLQFGTNVIRDQGGFPLSLPWPPGLSALNHVAQANQLTGIFNAKEFRFESDLKSAIGSVPVSPFTRFTVPEAESSEDEEDDKGKTSRTISAPTVSRYGSQTNPVNIDDFEEEITIPDPKDVVDLPSNAPKSDTKAAAPQPKARTPEWGYQNHNASQDYPVHFFIDMEDDDAGDDSLSEASSQDSQLSETYAFTDHAENGSSDEEEEKEEAAGPAPVRDANNPQATEKESPRFLDVAFSDSDDSASEISDDEFSYRSDNDTNTSPADPDSIRRSKMLEMLHQDRQKEFELTKDSGPGQASRFGNLPRALEIVSQTPTTPARPSGMPMDLSNIMADERGTIQPSSENQTPPSKDIDVENFTARHNALKAARTAKDEGPSKTFIPVPLSQAFVSPWGPAPLPPRPTAPKSMPWIGDVAEYNTPVKTNEPWLDSQFPQMFPSDYRVPPDVSYYDRPCAPPFQGFQSSCNTFCARPEQAPKPAIDRLDGNMVITPTPPPAYSGGPSSSVPVQEQQEPLRSRTKMSIPEIVEEAPSARAATPTPNLKRKFEDMEEEERLDKPTSSVANVESAKETKHEKTALPKVVEAVPERPNKRLRLQFAATAVAGAVVGGLGMLGALISVPDSWLQ